MKLENENNCHSTCNLFCWHSGNLLGHKASETLQQTSRPAAMLQLACQAAYHEAFWRLVRSVPCRVLRHGHFFRYFKSGFPVKEFKQLTCQGRKLRNIIRLTIPQNSHQKQFFQLEQEGHFWNKQRTAGCLATPE